MSGRTSRGGRATAGALALVAIVAGNATVATAQPVRWDTPLYASSGWCPDLAGEPISGVMHLVWTRGEDPQYVRLDADGSVLLEEAEMVWHGEEGPDTFGPAVAAGPGAEAQLAYKQRVQNWQYNDWIARRTDAGWASPVLLASNALRGYAPQAAADDHGVSVVFSLGANLPESVVSHWQLVDGVVVSDHHNLLDTRADDRIDIVAGAGNGERHLFAGKPDAAGSVEYAWSDDGGGSWTVVGAIQSPVCAGAEVGQPDAAAAPDGAIHLVYGCAEDSEASGAPSVRHAVIRDHAVVSDQRLTGPGTLEDWSIGVGIGRVAVTGEGRVVVAWLTGPSGGLRATSSDDGGASWHPVQQLADVGGSDEGRNTPALAAVGEALFLAYSDGSALYVQRGAVDPPGDDDDSAADDDDDTGTDDDDDDDSGDTFTQGDCYCRSAGAAPAGAGAGGRLAVGLAAALLLARRGSRGRRRGGRR